MKKKSKHTPNKNDQLRIEYEKLSALKAHPRNPKQHNDEALGQSFERFGFTMPIAIDEAQGFIAAGHGRLERLVAMQAAGEKPPDRIQIDANTGEWLVPVIKGLAFKDPEELEAYLIADNRITELGGWNSKALVALLENQAKTRSLQGTGFDMESLAKLLAEQKEADEITAPDPEAARRSLAEDFLVPPFSVLDSRQGYWQDRRRAWLGLGIESEVGRGSNLLKMSDTILEAANSKAKAKTFGPEGNVAGDWTGTSIFDPVLCELAYRWFCPPAGRVLDPFAGGSVRGIVAGSLGLAYTGVDLRHEQIAANLAQSKKINPSIHPAYICGDSSELEKLGSFGAPFDFVFSCPPYFDLERYSEDPRDLSAAKHYDNFIDSYNKIIAAAVGHLKPNRFACFVVTEIRDKKGIYRQFVPDTISAFEAAGAKFYNEAILINSVGTLALRVRRMFESFRKLGRCHQNCLVFYKGDTKRIPIEFPELKVPDIFASTEESDISGERQ